MSVFVYSTQKGFDGPWLVGRVALDELNDVLEEISERFEVEVNKQVEAEIVEYIEDYPPDTKDSIRESIEESIALRHQLRKNVKISLSSSKYLQGQTIKELLANPELQDEAPVGIEVEISAAGRKARFQLGREFFGDPRLNISVSPETDGISREAFADLQLWAVNHQPPVWQQIWGKFASYHWLIWLLLISLSSFIVPSSSDDVQAYLEPKTHKILLDGVSEDELPAAVELLLQYQVKTLPKEVSREFPAWFGVLFFGGMAVCVILSIRPTMVIGLGRNKNKLEFWLKWVRFVSVTIPGIIFASFVWPYIVVWVKAAF